MLSAHEALAAILDRIEPLPPQVCPLGDALGRVLAEPVVAREPLPPFTNSAMDGFALRAVDTPGRLRLLAAQPAGVDTGQVVVPGTAVRVMTGAPLPVGADTVVPLEDAVLDLESVHIEGAVRVGAHIRVLGEDVAAGEVVLTPGTRLRPAEVGLLGAVGAPRVWVFPAPRVAVLTTGDELVDVAEPLGPARIRDANIHALCAQVRACGAVPVPIARVPDTAKDLEAAIRQALVTADVICTNGGVSMGDLDHVRPVLERLGAEPVFWQVAQKPGRPMAFSRLDGKPVFGIPGNPVAAQLCFERYVRPALLQMMGLRWLHRPRLRVQLAEPIRKAASDTRTHLLRVLLEETAQGVVARLTGPQGSGLLTSMTRSQALLVLAPEAHDLPAGAWVEVCLTDLPEDH